MYNNEACKWRLTAQHPQHVVKHGTRGGGDQADTTRCVWDRSLTGRIKEALCLERALQRFEFAREQAHPASSLHRCSDELIAAPRAIEIDAATDNNDLADRWRLLAWANRATEANYIKCGLFISQGQVLMARRAAHGALHFASDNTIS